MEKRNKLYNKLKRLKQYKNLSQEDLYKIIDKKLEFNDILDGLTFIATDEEKKLASDLIQKYLSDSTIENEADKDTLKQLIDLEILMVRIKEFMRNEFNEKNGAIPIKMMEQLRQTTDQIIQLKKTIGLTGEKTEKLDALQKWELLEKKTLNYYEEHAGCILHRCPECQAIYQLMFDRTKYKEAKCNWYRGTILYNPYLYEIYHKKRITKEEMAKIFNVSAYDIDYLYKGIFLKDLRENDSKN